MSECLWNSARDEDWNIFDDLWYDIRPCLREIEGYIALGEPPLDAYAKATKDKKLKRKVIKVILILKGHAYTQIKEIDIDKYKISVGDINLLLEEYNKRKNELSVIVDGVMIK